MAAPSARAAASPEDARRARQVAHAVTALVVIMPLDGYVDLTHGLGFNIAALAGYVVLLFALPSVGTVVRAMGRPWMRIAGALGLGTVVALLSARPVGFEVLTAWQALGLWAFVHFACVSLSESWTVVKAFLGSNTLSLLVYCVLYLTGTYTKETFERVETVAGFQTNIAGFTAAALLVGIVGTLPQWSRRFRWFLLLVGAPVSLAVMLLAGSRGGLVALAGGLVVYLLPGRRGATLRRIRAVLAVVFGSALVTLSMGLATTEELVERQVSRWTGEKDISQLTANRSDILAAGLRLSAESPVGLGIGNAKFALAPSVFFGDYEKVDSHNEFLRVLLECGWLGFGLYVGGVGGLLAASIKLLRERGSSWPLALLVALLLGCLSSSLGLQKIMWIVLGLVSGAIACAQEPSRNWAKPLPRSS